MRLRFAGLICLIIIVSSCRDVRIKEHKDWDQFYNKYGIKDACIMIRDNNHESIHYLNKDRCIKRFTPASTFKVFNSLVALETAVAPDDHLVIKWDGIDRKMPEWNKDMDMAEAFKLSNVGYYQEIARRIGAKRMQHYLDTCKYGNMNMDCAIDSFWLNDTLKISADEQIGLLKKMYFYELPMSERSQRMVKALMLREQAPNFKLYYKTGVGKAGDKWLYWVVGFTEKITHGKEHEGSMNKADERNYPYFFAQNFEMPMSDTSKDWLKVRIDVLHEVLKDYGALPR